MDDDSKHQHELLVTYRRSLEIYLGQLAQQGAAYATPGLIHSAAEARSNIRRIKDYLRSKGIAIEDLPIDTPTDQEPLPAPRVTANARSVLIIGAVALVAIVAIIAWRAAPWNNFTIGNNSSGIIAGGDVTTGDASTSADKRYAAALASVRDEILSNFTSLTVTVQAIARRPPASFWDKRRANETEAAYQDRASSAFRDYRLEIDQYFQQLKYSKQASTAFVRDLAYNADVAQHIKDLYTQQDWVVDAFTSYVSDLQHEADLNLSDVERADRSISLHKEKIADARRALSSAAAQLCQISDQTTDIQSLNDSLKVAGIQADLRPGTECSKTAQKLAASFAAEKASILQARLSPTAAAAREIDRRINDPYLILLRNAAGLPPTLTITEVVTLQSRQIDQTESDPAKLFTLAAESYIESDGSTAAIYFRRAIAADQIPATLKRYAELSVDRIEHPERYGQSIGVMVMKLTDGGNFATAGLKIGDVIISIGAQTVNEPMEVASALTPKGPVLLNIVRDGQAMIVSVQGGESAGAMLSQLIILNAVQL